MAPKAAVIMPLRISRPRRTDEHAIENIAPYCHQWRGGQPGQIGRGVLDDARIAGEEADDRRAELVDERR